MSQTWVVVPLDADCAAWLDQLGVPHPPPTSTTGPVAADVSAALDDLGDLEREMSGSAAQRYVTVSDPADRGRRTELSIREHAPGEPVSLGFRNGPQELLERIVRAVAARCRPLVLVAASDPEPIVCTSGPTTHPIEEH